MNLAYRLRPQNLEEFIGQDHLVGEGKIIRKMIESGNLFSMILWGPPGSGKTTLAQIIAKQTQADFHQLSGVTSGKKDLLGIVSIAESHKNSPVLRDTPLNKGGREAHDTLDTPRGTILFIDEIHRWNKAQQDALLPYVESGLITLIGATTENPSFEVISALLSRSRIFVLKSLSPEELGEIIENGLDQINRDMVTKKTDTRNRANKITITPDAKDLLIRLSGGDARIMLNALEMSVTNYSSSEVTRSREATGKLKTDNRKTEITPSIIQEVFQTKSAGLYDKKADEHYNIISAFIKSMRGSDVDAALYYLARMLENGEDPKFIARRMIIFASEDIGIADRGALIQANEAFEAVTKIGMPEAQLTLAHITIYLSLAKKSRSVPNALALAKEAVYQHPNEPIPLHLRNAPTKLMQDLGYAKDYSWQEGNVGPASQLSFSPEKLRGRKYYRENTK